MIYRFDADGNGTESIATRIKNGSIQNLDAGSFAAFDEKAAEFQKTIKAGDVVIIDTLSSLLETTRTDMMLGDDPAKLLWTQHTKFYGDKQFLNTYRAAQSLTLRRIKNLERRGAHVIVVCHEAEGKDPMTTIGRMAVPQVNPAMVDDLLGACSDVFRLVLVTESTQHFQRGEHVLFLRRTDEYTAKFQVDPAVIEPAKVPDGIKEPTMQKLCDVLHKVPRVLCIYGTPGSGKTTLAASIADVLPLSADAARATTPPKTATNNKTDTKVGTNG